MLTLYHSPNSRSTRIIGLIEAMNIRDKIDIRLVSIVRQDGSGGQDASNLHPEGKVPCLVHNGVEIWESAAIILYLTDLFPESGPKGGMGVPVGHAQRGRYVSWLTYYAGIVEPVLVHHYIGAEHPALQATFRGMPELTARLKAALSGTSWLVDDRYTAADLLMASPFQWFTDITPDDPAIRDWLARCSDRPFHPAVKAFETEAMAALC